MPDPIMARYNECDPVPNLSTMDEHAGHDCTKKYSNPQFFREKWIQEEMVSPLMCTAVSPRCLSSRIVGATGAAGKGESGAPEGEKGP